MTYEWFDVTRNAGIARIINMSYRSKTYTWNNVILVKRSMIRVFFSPFTLLQVCSTTLFSGYCETCSDTSLLELPTASATPYRHLPVILIFDP